MPEWFAGKQREYKDPRKWLFLTGLFTITDTEGRQITALQRCDPNPGSHRTWKHDPRANLLMQCFVNTPIDNQDP